MVDKAKLEKHLENILSPCLSLGQTVVLAEILLIGIPIAIGAIWGDPGIMFWLWWTGLAAGIIVGCIVWWTDYPKERGGDSHAT